MNSDVILFIIFSIVAAFLYNIIPINKRRYFLLLINSIFYFMCDPKYLLLLIFLIVTSYTCGRRMNNLSRRDIRKVYMILEIIFLCAILALFKYWNFFATNKSSALQLLMPLGISYYTFKIISYLVDLYQGQKVTIKSIEDYAIYISFFPQIICGPITRENEILDYIHTDTRVHYTDIKSSIYRICSGLFKKIVIADRLCTYVNTVFENYDSYPSLALWMAAFFYAIQLYCDFAGYSEIVIGITNLFGFHCMDNFKLPYFSSNIKEFWTRWHISLSSWLRDYIYIPLGGNRLGKIRQKVNIILVFLISGIWHGNNLNFVIWGLYHGILNILSPKQSRKSILKVLQIISTFICVMFGWILFKTKTLEDTIYFVSKMFSGLSISLSNIITSVMPFTGDYSCLSYLLTVCVLILALFIMEWRDYYKCKKLYLVRFILFFTTIVFFGVIGENSFIYANF